MALWEGGGRAAEAGEKESRTSPGGRLGAS